MSGYDGYADFSQSNKQDWSGYGQGNGQPQQQGYPAAGGDQGYGNGYGNGAPGYAAGGANWGAQGGAQWAGQGYDQGYGQGYDNSYGGYGQGGRTIDNYMPRDCSDCIYVAGLPADAKKDEISSFFCRAGTILVTKGVQRIFCFMDKMKQPTGDCTVTYENPDASMRAIEMFNGKDFNGKGAVAVSIATPEQKQPFANKLLRDAQKNRGGGYGGGGFAGGRGGGGGRGAGGGRGGRGGGGGGFRGGPRGRGGFRGGGDRGGRGGPRPGGRPAPY